MKLLRTFKMILKQKNCSGLVAAGFSNNPVVSAFMAGSFSGTCSTILLQPLDLLKTRVQQVEGRKHEGLLSMTKEVIGKERLFGLWRGVFPSLVRTVPGVGIYFSTMHKLKVTMCHGSPSPCSSLLIGGFSRAIAGCIMIPVTVVKIRCESGVYEYKSVSGALRSILRVEGVRGLMSGLLPTLLRDAPFSGIYLMCYEKLKVVVAGRTRRADLEKVWCGLGAGVLASLITQPADVVKTQLQLKPTCYATKVMGEIYIREGPLGFFKGGVPRMLRRTLMAALAWGVYEQAMRNIGIK